MSAPSCICSARVSCLQPGKSTTSSTPYTQHKACFLFRAEWSPSATRPRHVWPDFSSYISTQWDGNGTAGLNIQSPSTTDSGFKALIQCLGVWLCVKVVFSLPVSGGTDQHIKLLCLLHWTGDSSSLMFQWHSGSVRLRLLKFLQVGVPIPSSFSSVTRRKLLQCTESKKKKCWPRFNKICPCWNVLISPAIRNSYDLVR